MPISQGVAFLLPKEGDSLCISFELAERYIDLRLDVAMLGKHRALSINRGHAPFAVFFFCGGQKPDEFAPEQF